MGMLRLFWFQHVCGLALLFQERHEFFFLALLTWGVQACICNNDTSLCAMVFLLGLCAHVFGSAEARRPWHTHVFGSADRNHSIAYESCTCILPDRDADTIRLPLVLEFCGHVLLWTCISCRAHEKEYNCVTPLFVCMAGRYPTSTVSASPLFRT
jgi:hypothetical protein